MIVYYDEDYTAAAHAFTTTRKAGWLAADLTACPISGLRLASPERISTDTLCRVHDRDYVTAVRTGQPRPLAESQGFGWDPGLWASVLASTSGVVAAARQALSDGVSGSLSDGLHHARRDTGRGCCTFNGLALAARMAKGWGCERVLILDLDAHCGGGTQSILGGDPGMRQVDIALIPFDTYRPLPPHRLVLAGPQDYRALVRGELARLETEGPFDLCLYNAGMDPFDAGVGAGALHAREAMVFDWLAGQGIPTAFVLAGGYVGPGLDEAGLVALHRATLTAAAGAERAMTRDADQASEPIHRESLPYGDDLEGRFPNRRMIRGFEGGAIYAAEADGRFYILLDEGTMADFLGPEDEDLRGGLVTVLTFETAPARNRWLWRRFGAGHRFGANEG